MATQIERGFLVLADLSGFTEFVSTTELEHGPQITAALLETVMDALGPTFQVQEVEGDAVFVYSPDAALVRPVTALDVLEGAFVAFKKKQRDMQIGTTCPCNACRAIPTLGLKFVAHHGSWLRQTVGGRTQLAGADVILVHRLLKNRVEGKRAYLLLSDAASTRIGVDCRASGLDPHTETYEHLGEVQCHVGDLDPVWTKALDAAVVRVPPQEALARFDVTLAAPPPVAWDWLLAPEQRATWGVDIVRVEQETPGRPRIGAVSHCHHGDGSVVGDEILDWRPFDYFTRLWTVGGGKLRETCELVATPEGTRVTSLWDVGAPLPPEARDAVLAQLAPAFERIAIWFRRLEQAVAASRDPVE